MKKIAITLFLLFCMCLPSHADDFVQICDDDTWQIYVDLNSIELRKTGKEKYLVAWVMWVQ